MNSESEKTIPAGGRVPLGKILGPGLITGASDDDPSGIATYSQAGAQFGYGLTWTLLFTYPLMAAIQEISARIGRVTGRGIAGNIRRYYPRPLLFSLVGLVLVANVINLGADLGAMGAGVKLLVGGPAFVYIAAFGVASVLLEVFMRYSRYVSVLKWLSLSLLAYAATAFIVHVPWSTVALNTFLPHIVWKPDYFITIVAVFGTTISPYLFFWQAETEVEDQQDKPGAEPLTEAPEQAREEIRRIEIDTYFGMGISNLVALFIVVTTAATLNVHGITDIQTSADAAKALRPLAGDFAFAIFAAGIIGTGLLALPVLAGSAAYALGEALAWPVGLARLWFQARAFYATIAIATAIGVVMNYLPIDPMKMLFWSAVINGVAAVPIMAMMMLLGTRTKVMGRFTLPPALRWMGWIATAVMAAAALAMMGSLLI
ncbi:MAG TPA: divalent metal cation transporter [Candidatus Polarisedimenticolia bacterium]|jgi:NRAMP (natural resistance-associated macrophage protein)-like metal ion transporter|nr:divalent metal cation transporter [Candidatus Polarisedimenticolia bacterium]